jgi:hypothetical protein
MDERKTGLAAALEATGPGEPPVAPVEQLPLLPADQLEALPDDATARRQALTQPRRGPGRPPGARNRSTEDWRRYLLSKYRSPLEALAEAYSRPVRDLAAELDCKPIEAFAVQMRAAADLAPYLHGKMPVEVAFTGPLPVLHLVAPEDALRAFQAEQQDGPLLDLSALEPLAESEENQGVSGAGEKMSDGGMSDDGEEGEGNQ